MTTTRTLGPKRQALAEQAASIIASYAGRVTLRQVFYRLVSACALPNTESAYKGLSGVLVAARELGLVRWDAMEDRTRGVESPLIVATPAECLSIARSLYREDLWAGLPRVGVIVEKAALAGVIGPVCEQWRVPFLAARGFCSATIVEQVARQWDGYRIVYLGDLDPSGVEMVEDWQRRLGRYGAAVTLERLALTMEQVAAYALPPQPVKLSDSRSGRYVEEHGHGVWELDALPPDVLVDTLVEAIIRDIDVATWHEAVVLEDRRRQAIGRGS